MYQSRWTDKRRPLSDAKVLTMILLTQHFRKGVETTISQMTERFV